jgi:4-diphosphocytidyl-2-C-methyl-D-erythritol kinase
VGDKCSDGFHTLESLVVFAEECDVLSFEHADQLSLRITGPFADALNNLPDNLVLHAARSLHGERGAAITLEKNLPIAAGIGGGSADAGATLRGLNIFWKLERNVEELTEIAATLGSDVPACLLSQPAWVTGRGEIVSAVGSIAPFELVLVNPNTQIATASVFSRLNLSSGLNKMRAPSDEITNVKDLALYLDDSSNDLKTPACAIEPIIDEVIEELAHEPGCVLSQMSGSGGTCFGVFQGSVWADGAADRIMQDHANWWVRRSRIARSDIGALKSL